MSLALHRVARSSSSGQHHLWWWLLTLTGPDPAVRPRLFSERLRVRRARLVRVLLVASFPLVLAFDPGIFSSPPVLIASLLAAVLVLVSAAILNRSGMPELAAALLLGMLMGTIAFPLVFDTRGLLSLLSLTRFTFFVLPITAAGFTIHRRAPFVLAALAAGCVLEDFFRQPKGAALPGSLPSAGWGLAVGWPLLLFGGVAVCSWLAERTMERELWRADRAEELAQAEQHIAQQSQQLLKQRRELETGLAGLHQTMARLANGDYSARTRLQENPLLPLAASLNLLVDRLQRLAAFEDRYQALEVAVNKMAVSLERNALGTPCSWPLASGTAADRLRLAIAELEQARLRQLRREIDELSAGLRRVNRWEEQTAPFMSGGLSHSRGELARLSERVARLQAHLGG